MDLLVVLTYAKTQGLTVNMSEVQDGIQVEITYPDGLSNWKVCASIEHLIRFVKMTTDDYRLV